MYNILFHLCFPGSSEEREYFQTACSYLKSNAQIVFAAAPVPPPPGIKIQITGEKELPPGDPLSLNLLVENESDQSKTVTVSAGCQLQAYTGKIIASLASFVETVEVAEKQGIFNNLSCIHSKDKPLNISGSS